MDPRPSRPRPLAERAGSVGPYARAPPRTPDRRDGLLLRRTGRQRQKGAVGKFQIPAEDLHLTFPATFSFDHELGADRKPAGKTIRTVRHNDLLECRHPASAMCR